MRQASVLRVAAILALTMATVVARIPFRRLSATDRGGGAPISISPHQLEEVENLATVTDGEEQYDVSEIVETEQMQAVKEKTHQHNSSEQYAFSIYQPGDGHEEDEDGIPGRFLRMQKGNRPKAKAAFLATQRWRNLHGVDRILARPHPKFDLCCQALPHCFLGRDTDGKVVFCQRPGFLNFTIANDLSKDDLLYHYTYILEYCWNILEPIADGTMTSVLDLTGVTFGKMKEMMGFVKEFVSMMSAHYPQRSHKTLLINCPRWFGSLFNLIKPLLRESTKKKIQILNKGDRQAEVLGGILETVPEELLTGEPSRDWESLPVEVALRDFCLEGLERTGLEMATANPAKE